MKIMVISDIHAFAQGGDGDKPSYVKVADGAPQTATGQFLDFIKANPDYLPDVILCPGDMCDRAEPIGLQYAWGFLNELKELSPNAILFGTVGNHDLDSRFNLSDFDAKGMLQELRPSFPYVPSIEDVETSTTLRRQYWSDNFFTVVHQGIRFVILNSAAFHGYGKVQEGGTSECEHGRISEATLRHLKKHLKEENDHLKKVGEPPIRFSVLMCHHHLMKDGEINDKDYSEMIGGSALLEMLSDTHYGRWLVVHGHRHKARLFPTGGSTAPYILSAASFSSTNANYPAATPNQVHLINVDLDEMLATKLIPCGTIKSLTYNPAAKKWLDKQVQSGGLPFETGFGFRGSLEELADLINTKIGPAYENWGNLVSEIPKLTYIDCEQLTELRKILQQEHSIELIMTQEGSPFQCGRSEP